MSTGKTWLPKAIVEDVLKAVLHTGIQWPVMLSGLAPEVRGALTVGSGDSAALYKVMHELNWWTPADGQDCPLREVLVALDTLMGPRKERQVVVHALAVLDEGITVAPPPPKKTTRDFVYAKARDSFEAGGYKVLHDAHNAETFIASLGRIVSVVAVAVESAALSTIISTVRAEVTHIRQFGQLVEGCIVMPLSTTVEDRFLVESSGLRVIDAAELQGMTVDDVERVVRAQMSELSADGYYYVDEVEVAFRAFQSSEAQLLVVSGKQELLTVACRAFVIARAEAHLDGFGVAPLWLALAEPIAEQFDHVAIPHFRKNGVRCSSLGLRLMMKEGFLLPIFETQKPPRRKGKVADLVNQAISPHARAVLFTASDVQRTATDYADALQLPRLAIVHVALEK